MDEMKAFYNFVDATINDRVANNNDEKIAKIKAVIEFIKAQSQYVSSANKKAPQ